MTPDVMLPKLPLEGVYREVVNRYLALAPTKAEYADFLKALGELEKTYAKDKAKLHARFVGLCHCMKSIPEDHQFEFFLGELDG
jgi:hypothetical protein